MYKCKITGSIFKIENINGKFILKKRRDLVKGGGDWWTWLVTDSKEKALVYLKDAKYILEACKLNN